MGTVIMGGIVAVAALLFRLPFLRLPMDEDFGFYAYRARFAADGLRWKKDIFLIYPAWKVHILDAIYGSDPARGVVRVRWFLAAMHVFTSLTVFGATAGLTGYPFMGMVAGLVYAFAATVPMLTSHSINMEQLYLPFLLAGMYLLLQGEFVTAGLCFGLATIPKIAAGLYIPVLALGVWWQFGFEGALYFAAAGALTGLASRALDRQLGYLDDEAKRQYATRYAVAVRLGALKRRYGSIRGDFKSVLGETLPAWLIGLPALAFLPWHPQAVPLFLFLLVTVLMVVFQQAYSRYHYLPLVAAAAVATGIGIVHAKILLPGALSLIFIASLLKFDQLKAFYLKPLLPATLARYDKFEQYLYLPHLGRALGRLIRMRKEKGRMFVWGNFTQLYHYAGLPASDAYLHYAIGPWDDERLAGYYDTVIGGFLRHKPLYVAKTFPNLDMALLAQVTGLHYRLVTTALARFPLYRLERAEPPARDPLALPWEEKLALFARLTEGENVPGIDTTDLLTGNFRRAIKECRKLLRINSGDRDALDYLERLYAAAGRQAEGTALFEKMLAQEPRRPHLRLLLARQARAAGNTAELVRLVDEEVERFGPGRDTEYLKACYYEAEGDHAVAGEIFWKLVEKEPDNAEFALHLARNMERMEEERENALTIYEETMNLVRRPGDGWIKIAAAEGVARLSGRPLSALLQEKGAAEDKEETVRYALASACDREGDKQRAAALFGPLAGAAHNPAVRGAACYRLALLSGGEERKRLLAACLALLPGHGAARALMETEQ